MRSLRCIPEWEVGRSGILFHVGACRIGKLLQLAGRQISVRGFEQFMQRAAEKRLPFLKKPDGVHGRMGNIDWCEDQGIAPIQKPLQQILG